MHTCCGGSTMETAAVSPDGTEMVRVSKVGRTHVLRAMRTRQAPTELPAIWAHRMPASWPRSSLHVHSPTCVTQSCMSGVKPQPYHCFHAAGQDIASPLSPDHASSGRAGAAMRSLTRQSDLLILIASNGYCKDAAPYLYGMVSIFVKLEQDVGSIRHMMEIGVVDDIERRSEQQQQ